MLRFDEQTRTWQRDEHLFELHEPQEPEYFDDTFPDGEVPKIVFNHRHVPMRPASQIWITDTTFRDGQQAMPPFTAQQVCVLYDLLHQLGGERGLIRASEFFLYQQRDRAAVEGCLALGHRYPEVTAWIRAHPKDFQLVRDMGLSETGILTSVSDYHIFHKWPGANRRAVIDRYLGVVKECLSAGIRCRCHFEDLTRADFYGFVVPFAIELRKLADESGVPIKIRACDTMGYGVPYPGASLPRSVPGIIYGLSYHAGIPSEWLEWHGHNDFHKALVNSVTAWLYGCCAVNATCLGVGERTGNTPMEALVIEYLSLRGDDTVRTEVITEIARFFRKEVGYEVPAQQPLVGSRFNTTLAGIHADGLAKDKRIYTIFDTEKILGVRPDVRITDKSGRAGVAHWVNLNLGLLEERRVDKDHPGVGRMFARITEQYEQGRVTIMSSQELLELVTECIPALADEARAARP
jgi:isopropylmalate/homocitrate/citramalate synthase